MVLRFRGLGFRVEGLGALLVIPTTYNLMGFTKELEG